MAKKKQIEQNTVAPTVKEDVNTLEQVTTDLKAEEVVEVIQEAEPIVESPVEVKQEPVAQAATAEESELTIEEKIVNFVNSREGEIKLNPFLKSLYPRPILNEPEIYLRQGESKAIKHTIQKLVDRNEFQVKGDTHKLLGSFYYNDAEQKTKYHNINTIEVVVNK